MGVNAVGLTNDRILSPTRAMINGRETILAGTNNYMGITFDADCVKAGQEAMAEFGTGTTGSRIANGSYAMHKELEAETCQVPEAQALHRLHHGLSGQPGHDVGSCGSEGYDFSRR